MSTLTLEGVKYRQNTHGFAVYLHKPRPTFLRLDRRFTDLFAFRDRSILR